LCEYSKIPIYCNQLPGNRPISIGNSSITYTTPRTKHQFLGAFFSQTLGTSESLRHAKTQVKSLCHLLKNKSIGPARLKYILKAVVIPSAAYQFSFCPSTPDTLRELNSEIAKAIKSTLILPKYFPSCFLFHPDAFGATEAENAYLQKSLGDLLVASQSGSTSEEHAKTYICQLSWELCNPYNPLTNPTQLGTIGFKHLLTNTSSLMAQYGLSFRDPKITRKPRAITLLNKPIDGRDVDAMLHSGLCEIPQFGIGPQVLQSAPPHIQS
jgi:hypothetical protein